MTIVTKPLTGVKKEKEATEALVTIENTKKAECCDEPDLQLSVRAERVRRVTRTNVACLSLTLAFITLLGFMAGSHIYKTMFMRRVFCNQYRVPFPFRTIKENSLIGGRFQKSSDDLVGSAGPEESVFAVFNHDIPEIDLFSEDDPKDFQFRDDSVRDFEFDVELDLEDDSVETLELPEIFAGRYVHDFMVNRTVIVDVLGQRCFLMKLDRTLIPKPRNIFDYLNKERDGVYDLNYEEIKKSYKIVGGQLQEFDLSHGRFIPVSCFGKTTFELEEVPMSGIQKREVGSSGSLFGEFVAGKIIKYNIVNLQDAA